MGPTYTWQVLKITKLVMTQQPLKLEKSADLALLET